MRLNNLLTVAVKTGLLMRSQWWPKSKIESYQHRKLGESLTHAVNRIPYYRDLGVGSAADPHAWLGRFPVLAKADLQGAAGELLWPDYPERSRYRSRTSGSTGEPTTTYFDEKTWYFCKYALKARRVLNATGLSGLRLLVVGEKSERDASPADEVAGGGRFFKTQDLFVEDPVTANVERLVAFQPTAMYGYPSYLSYLADKIRQHGFAVPVVPIVFTSSELLDDHARQRLESAYSARVIDVYGSTEFKEVAVQCENGRYHINFESVFVESAPGADSGPPRLVITSLLNRAMPLIRFDIGDRGYLGDGSCECGRHGPYIESLHGRQSEILEFPDGTAVTSYEITTAVGSFAEIRNYTVVHRAPDEVALEVFANPPMSDERRDALLAEVASHLPDDVRLSFEPRAERVPVSKRVAVRRDF